MPRTVWTKLQSDPNGSWTRHEGDVPFSIFGTADVAYDVRTDTGETFVITPFAPSGTAQITGLIVSNQDAMGVVSLAYSITNNSSVDAVLTTASTPPSRVQILAGLDHTGVPAQASFSDNWTTNGSDSLPDIPSSLPAGTYFLHVLPSGGGDADVVSSNGFALDSTPPNLVVAETNQAGDQILLTFSESLSGSSIPSNWTVTADGSNVTVGSVGIAGANITLSMSAVLATGTTLALSYNGASVFDAVSNPLNPFSNQTITNNVPGSFTENAVTVGAGAYLTANDVMPSDARALLMFASLTQLQGYDARAALLSWNGVNGGFHSQFNTGEDASGVRLRVESGAAAITAASTTLPTGTRYHVLVSAWAEDPDLRVVSYIMDTTNGIWVQVIDQTDAATGGGVIDLTGNPLRLFTRSDGTNQNFAGTLNRIALWTATGGTPLADITQASVRDQFAAGSSITDPAISRSAFGQPLVDFDGDATDYNTGTHNGSFGDFTPTGSFS